MTKSEIGGRIANLRRSAGMTQQELAGACDVSKNTIWNVENGRHNPERIAPKLATALDVSINFLLGRPEEKTAIDVSRLSDTDRLLVRQIVERLS